MGNRLSRIATRTGDDGSTGLGDGSRTTKDSLRIASLGEVDELNSQLGVLLAEPLPNEIAPLIRHIQNDLFDLGGELSIPGHSLVTPAHLLRLDQALEQFNATLPALREFILPGGAKPAALAHLARAVARRAERSVVALARHEAVNVTVIQYLNRLSDLLFVLGRQLNRAGGGCDVLWTRETK
jgi:cob(I)alamin adenosyltransferase